MFKLCQLVSSFDEIGEPGQEEFKKLALVNKICVKTEHVGGETNSVEDDAARIVQEISQHAEASVVILWMKVSWGLTVLREKIRKMNGGVEGRR